MPGLSPRVGDAPRNTKLEYRFRHNCVIVRASTAYDKGNDTPGPRGTQAMPRLYEEGGLGFTRP
ncbi:hypothetical protein Ancab_038489 [Ancistrocladus abbreviatus]